MGDPVLAVMHKKYGRLYRWPGSDLPETMRPAQMNDALREGLLVPSVTNVIDVRGKDYLQRWYAKHAANAALELHAKHPDRVAAEPAKAREWIIGAAGRDLESAASRGTRVHDACETLARGLPAPALNDDEEACLVSWRAFLDRWRPAWEHLEVTCFGEADGLRYAGTGDFVAVMNGLRTLGDYKCLVPETPVLMADGSTLPASGLSAGDIVVAWTDEKGLHAAPVAWVADNGHQETYRIRAVGGWEVQVTAEHPFLVRRRTRGASVTEWVKADSVRAGDYVHLALGWHGDDHDGSVSVNDAYLLGLLAGGGMTQEHGWTFTNEDPGVVAAMGEHLARHEAHLTPKTGSKNDYRIGFDAVHGTGVGFRIWVESHGLRCGSHEKRVPPAIRSAGPAVRAAFLSGLLDTDGHVRDAKDRGRVSFHSVNRDMVADVRQMLTNFDVKASLNTVRTGYEGEPHAHYAGVVGSGHGIARLAEILTPRGARGRQLTAIASRIGPVRRPPGHDAARVISVEHVRTLTPTIAIEVEGAHTHVTGGMITHNTTRSGLHTDVASQLAALAHAHTAVLDDGTLVPMPEIHAGVAVHLNRDGYQVSPVELDGPGWPAFRHCLGLWEWHRTDGDGSVSGARKAVGTPLRGPEALVASAGRGPVRAVPAPAGLALNPDVGPSAATGTDGPG